MKIILIFISLTTWFSNGFSDPRVAQEMLGLYAGTGNLKFNADQGFLLWNQPGITKNGITRTCATCHNKDLTTMGKHKKTGKLIKPMAISVNANRYTKSRKIKKWFKRNCKWTWGRECSPQEKGNILTYLLNN